MARLRRNSPTPSVCASSVFDGYSAATPEPQSRPGTRPGTAALSPSPSAASDKENHDVTPDTGFSKQSKGKGRMAPPPRPPMEQRGNKRRRLSEQPSRSASALPSPDDEEEAEEDDTTARNDMESHYTIPEQKWFNPEQDEDERRHVRLGMRENIRDFNDRRDELLADHTSEKLVKHVKKANRLYGSVRQTSDATIDSRFLVSASELAVRKAKADGDTSAGVDINEFLTKCISFMKTGGPPGSTDDADAAPRSTQARVEQQRRRSALRAESDDEADGDGDALPWHVLGAHACFPCNRRPPVPSFLLGPLSVQKRVRQATQRTQRRTQNAATQQVSRPQELRKEDLEANDNSNLTKLVTKIYMRLGEIQQAGVEAIEAALEEYDDLDPDALLAALQPLCERMHIRKSREDGEPGVPMYEFLTNPHHFGQTVENCFYVSFLVKEGKVKISQDEQKLPILQYVSNPSSIEEQRAQNVTRRQQILGLDHDRWRALIDVFDIQDPLIPHRQEEQHQVRSTGWYA